MRLRSRLMGAIAVAVAVAVAACSGVLGFQDLTLAPGDADASAGSHDGGAQDGAGQLTPDARVTEASADAGAPDAHADVVVTCGDTTSSAVDCGRCGHSCLGGVCANSACQPITLADSLGEPIDLVIDDANAYVTLYSAVTVLAMNKGDGGIVTLFTDMTYGPAAITKDDANVYFSNTNGTPAQQFIYRCGLSGCGDNPPTIGPAQGVSSLVLRGPVLYYGEETVGDVSVVAIATGAAQTLLSADAGLTPYSLAADDTWIYFTDRTNGSVRKVALDGGGPALLVGASGTSFGLSVTDAGIFWGTVDDEAGVSAVLHTDKNGVPDGGAVPVFALGNTPYGFAVDAQNVYWVNRGTFGSSDGSLATCPLSGCPSSGPTVLAAGRRSPRRLAVDDAAIYWVDQGTGASDGALMKIAKP